MEVPLVLRFKLWVSKKSHFHCEIKYSNSLRRDELYILTIKLDCNDVEKDVNEIPDINFNIFDLVGDPFC